MKRAYAAASIVLLQAGFWCPFDAVAQTAVDRMLFQKYLASGAHKDLVKSALDALPPEVFHRCEAFKPSEPDLVEQKPISFSKDGLPTAGAWRESLPVKGCGNDTILNFNFVVADDGTIKVLADLPGATHADRILQHDAVPYATTGASVHAKGCPQFIITNTHFDAFIVKPASTDAPAQKAKPELPRTPQSRPWRETWTVAGCGRKFDVPINFVPDATGTLITQKSEEIVER